MEAFCSCSCGTGKNTLLTLLTSASVEWLRKPDGDLQDITADDAGRGGVTADEQPHQA